LEEGVLAQFFKVGLQWESGMVVSLWIVFLGRPCNF
jgi:hypothetical protein